MVFSLFAGGLVCDCAAFVVGWCSYLLLCGFGFAVLFGLRFAVLHSSGFVVLCFDFVVSMFLGFCCFAVNLIFVLLLLPCFVVLCCGCFGVLGRVVAIQVFVTLWVCLLLCVDFWFVFSAVLWFSFVGFVCDAAFAVLL